MQSSYAVLYALSVAPRSARPLSCAPAASLLTAPVPSRTPPVLPGWRPLPVIIDPVFPAAPPCWTPLVESGVPAEVVADGPVVTPPAGAPPGPEPMGPVAPPGPTPPACGDAAPPACGEALGLETAPCAARLQASKSA